MNDKELGKRILEEVARAHDRNRTMEEHWEAMGARARALLAAVGARLPHREKAARQIAQSMYPLYQGNWENLTPHSQEKCRRAADLALSWHAPKPMEEDVERLAIWLGFVFNENSGNEGTGWDSEYEDDRNGHRAQARALIARYGTPPEVRKPTEREALLQDANLKLSRDNTALTDENARLTHERNQLGEALGKLLVAIGLTRADAPMTGPQLLLAADDAARCFKDTEAENARLRAALGKMREFVKPNGSGTTVVMRKDVLATLDAALAPSPAEAKVAEGGEQWEVATFIAADIEPGWEPFATSDFGHVICKRRRAGGGL